MGKKFSKIYTIRPLIHGSAQDVTIEHDYRKEIVQYEFYIPAAIWQHSAVKKFITQLSNMDPSATIFKGATGVWKGEQEDTYIYRLIFDSGEFTYDTTRSKLIDFIGKMMASLSEWHESAQDAFLFTENDISYTLSKKKKASNKAN